MQLPFPTERLWQERLSRTDGPYSYVAERDGELLGHIGLMLAPQPRRRHVGQFGMAVRDDCQGQGIGNALVTLVIDLADNWFNLKRLELEVFTDNAAAVHLYRKHGFEIEGESPAFAFRDGEYVSAYHMGRVRAL